MDLRPYQREAVGNTLAAFAGGHPSALVVMPTGTGKTVVAGAVVGDFAARKRKTLVLAHRGELLEQAADTFERFGLQVAVEKASQRANPNSLYDDAVVASVQTMRGERLANWPRDAFGLIWIDEAHHAVAPSYRAIFEHFRAPLFGVTATPERGDGEVLGQVFGHLAYEYALRDAIADEFLCRITIERPTTAVDLSKIRTTAGDLNQGDLEDEISAHIEELVNSFRDRVGARPAVVFTPDVGSAQAFADGLRQVGVTARSVSGKSTDRHDTVRAFKAGEFQVVVNCNLLTEGFDAPHVAAIGLARPTKSGVLYRQMVGRGTRLHPGKADVLVIDWAWNSGKHDLVSPVELFDTSKMDVEVQKIADDLIRKGLNRDPMAAIEEAEEIHRQRVATRVRVRERQSRYQFVAFDPFAIGGLIGVPQRHAGGGQPLTRYQQQRLEGFKIEAKGMGRSFADKLIGKLDERRQQGLATHRQVALLVAKGMDQAAAEQVRFSDVNAALESLGFKTQGAKR